MQAHCPCNAVTLDLDGDPLVQVYCHCDNCQRAHGAAYVPRAVFPRDAVSIVRGDTVAWLNRTRTMIICAKCGSHLYGESDAMPFRGVNAALFPAGAFKPEAHYHCRYAVAPVVDALPYYKDFLAHLGGSGDLVNW